MNYQEAERIVTKNLNDANQVSAKSFLINDKISYDEYVTWSDLEMGLVVGTDDEGLIALAEKIQHYKGV